MDIGRVIEIVRSLKEDAPTMSLGSPQTGSTPPTGKIAGTVQAGDDPPVDLRSKNTKGWNIFFKDLVRRNRKKKRKS